MRKELFKLGLEDICREVGIFELCLEDKKEFISIWTGESHPREKQ